MQDVPTEAIHCSYAPSVCATSILSCPCLATALASDVSTWLLSFMPAMLLMSFCSLAAVSSLNSQIARDTAFRYLLFFLSLLCFSMAMKAVLLHIVALLYSLPSVCPSTCFPAHPGILCTHPSHRASDSLPVPSLSTCPTILIMAFSSMLKRYDSTLLPEGFGKFTEGKNGQSWSVYQKEIFKPDADKRDYVRCLLVGELLC